MEESYKISSFQKEKKKKFLDLCVSFLSLLVSFLPPNWAELLTDAQEEEEDSSSFWEYYYADDKWRPSRSTHQKFRFLYSRIQATGFFFKYSKYK